MWDAQTHLLIRTLEGHKAPIANIAFVEDRLLVSTSEDHTVYLWRCDTWKMLDLSAVWTLKPFGRCIAFLPTPLRLAIFGAPDGMTRLMELNVEELLGLVASDFVHYTNTRVTLVGDTGVGKTAISNALMGKPFEASDSTPIRRVERLEYHRGISNKDEKETYEIFLWDLAGQPGCRLIQQLSLTEVAVAAVVFDARSDTQPLAGVEYWELALRTASRIPGQSSSLLTMKKILVAARKDRGKVAVGFDRIERSLADKGFNNYHETSAKKGWGITELKNAIKVMINWDHLPKVSSNALFQHIKDFISEEIIPERLLASTDDLYRDYLRQTAEDTTLQGKRAERADFETCIVLMESQGLIRHLSFGGLVLLKPEVLDAYASAIVNAARDDPEGLGCIAEEVVKRMQFSMPQDQRLDNKNDEEQLLVAAIEEMLRHEIVIREHSHEGELLVFPTLLAREYPDLYDDEGKTVIFTFAGPVINIYASLSVRLSRSGQFKKQEMWRNAITYVANTGGTCRILMREIREGQGELTLFYTDETSEETRFQLLIAPGGMRNDALDDWMRRNVTITQNISETCTMGPASDSIAVVDQYCRIYGLEGLRVADASVMPDVMRANTNATIMIAEHVAEFIRHGLERRNHGRVFVTGSALMLLMSDSVLRDQGTFLTLVSLWGPKAPGL